jgi:hypothetical protein
MVFLVEMAVGVGVFEGVLAPAEERLGSSSGR